ncbi:vWA domain-containing protein [Paenibacillus guangzhouensis]|uniref:vWA domain-containing protein n=1 Tax=Paenibacillus guangzhouensis TaxID=1473112 RepID=UPI001266B8F3|nr:vWA domain-containing protein [Paenibacillus guangzhouensis]
MYKNKIGLILLMLTFAMLFLPLAGLLPAAHAAAQSSKIDAVLVVDVSNSMNSSDKNKIGNEAMKMFIDMLSVQGDKVGIIAYTDRIEREKALLEIKSNADKQDLKQFIDQLNRGTYTDIAVGVREAIKVLEDGADPSHEPMIVVLADGNNALNKKSNRTQAQSDQELNQAVEDAKSKNVPIYTIGLNADGKLNKGALADLSKRTGAKSFETSSADDLPQILSEIFASHLKLNIVPIQSLTGNGKYQEVTVNVPNANVLEANISIMSSQPVDIKLTDPSGQSIPVPSNEVLVSKSKSYTLVKMLKPVQGDWKLQVKGVDKNKIDINLVFNYDLELAMDPVPQKTYKKGDTIAIGAYLTSNGQKLKDNALYSHMKAVLKVKDLSTGNVTEMPLTNAGDQFKGTYTVADQKAYELTVRAEEKSFYRESDAVTINGKATGGTAVTPSQPEPKDDKPFPIWPVVLGVLLLAAIATGGYFVLAAVKKANRGFVGQLVIEIRDENTGEKSHPQYKKLKAFKGKFNLHQLLQLAPEFKETEKIMFTPVKNDRIELKNLAASSIEKSGRTLDASRGLELKSSDRITITLSSIDKTIFIEYLV